MAISMDTNAPPTRICSGEIKGDPDIAGDGVIIALGANALLAILLSSSLWIYMVPYRGTLRLDDPRIKHPRWVHTVTQTLVIQGDTQLISGLAVMTASLVNIVRDEVTPLYHIFIARSLADLCLTGHLAAITLIYPTEHNWPLRLLLTVFVIVLYEYWTARAIERFVLWDGATPLCMENDNFFRGEYVHWMYLSYLWMPLGYSTIILDRFPRGSQLVDAFENSITRFPKLVAGFFQSIRPSLDLPVEEHPWFSCFAYTVIAVWLTPLCILWLTFVALFPASRTLAPIQSATLLAWNLYDIIAARTSNAHIVVANPSYRPRLSFQGNQNPEEDWGFGQIFPIVMLLLPFLTAADFYKGAEKVHEEGGNETSSHELQAMVGDSGSGVRRRRTALEEITQAST